VKCLDATVATLGHRALGSGLGTEEEEPEERQAKHDRRNEGEKWVGNHMVKEHCCCCCCCTNKPLQLSPHSLFPFLVEGSDIGALIEGPLKNFLSLFLEPTISATIWLVLPQSLCTNQNTE